MTPRYWKDSVGDLLTMFRPENLPSVSPQRVVWILFEVLTFIPEEVGIYLVQKALFNFNLENLQATD